MNQSNFIAGFLFLGFIIFIVMKGQLPAYKSIVLGDGKSTSTSNVTSSAVSDASTVLENPTVDSLLLGLL
jgi:hypothetical protein